MDAMWGGKGARRSQKTLLSSNCHMTRCGQWLRRRRHGSDAWLRRRLEKRHGEGGVPWQQQVLEPYL